MDKKGYKLKNTTQKGEGVYATRAFQIGETVMIGRIERELNKSHSHSSQIGLNRHVLHSGLIIKVNHSCDPNCGIHVNETGAHDFCAMKDIKEGDEITFDYAMRNYSVDYFPMECSCKSENCRRMITGWKSLSDDQKKAYKGFIAPYLLEIDEETSHKSSKEKSISSFQ